MAIVKGVRVNENVGIAELGDFISSDQLLPGMKIWVYDHAAEEFIYKGQLDTCFDNQHDTYQISRMHFAVIGNEFRAPDRNGRTFRLISADWGLNPREDGTWHPSIRTYLAPSLYPAPPSI